MEYKDALCFYLLDWLLVQKKDTVQTLQQQEVYSSCVHYCDSFLPRNRRHLSHLLNHIKSFFLEGKAHKNLLSLLLGVCCCSFSVRSQVITKKKRDVALLSSTRMFFVKRLKYYKRCLRLKKVHSEGSAKNYGTKFMSSMTRLNSRCCT